MSFRWKIFIGFFTVIMPTGAGMVFAQAAGRDQLSLHSLFRAEVLRSNVNTVRRKAAKLPLAERYEYLKGWVLPSALHPDFRIVGEFTPTNPSPRAIELEPHRFLSKGGGEPVSPVFDLLNAARELGRLQELFDEVDSLRRASRTVAFRAKLCLLIMIRFEQGKSASIEELIAQLYRETTEAFQDETSDYSAELLMLSRAPGDRTTFAAVVDLLAAFHESRFELNIDDIWESQLCTLMGRYSEYLESNAQDDEVVSDQSKFWVPVARSIAMTRGKGYPATEWCRTSNRELHLRSGHHRDYLFFAAPLTGNYEIAGDVDPGGRNQIMTAGLFVGPRGGGGAIDVGKFRGYQRVEQVNPPLRTHNQWTRYRAVVRDRELRVLLNERLLVEAPREPNCDPWIAVRGVSHSTGSLRCLEISGQPQIPDEIVLSSEAAFSSWYTYYFFTEDAGNPQSLWQWRRGTDRQGELVARRYPIDRGTSMESLLRYHRPLVEDGSIEFDFLYIPGRYEAHPALDRLVFLLEPDGVKLHWLTDGRFDRTLVPPDHAIAVPKNQRGPAQLPLKENGWNHLKLSIEGRVVVLELNGQLIYERELESLNLRTFGLFRFADRTGLRVRNIRMRGDWPKSVPPIREQMIADPRWVALRSQPADLPAEFYHDFVEDGLPKRIFQLTGQQLESGVTEEADGVHVRLNSASGWTVAAVMPQFSITGDFDVRAQFELKDLETGWQDGLAFLEVRLADEDQHYFRSMRGHQPDIGHTVRSQVMWGVFNERRRLTDERFASWARSGCFRIARVGDRLFSLFAPEDSASFRILRAERITDADVQMGGVLLELAMRDVSQGHVIWKDLSIKAERLRYLDPGQKPTRKLFAMSPDGKNLHELAAPQFGLSGLGSPEFSADGSRIVMDMSQGPVSTSHIVIVNRDGSDMKDLGMGCMPSLSKDGKTIVFSDPGAGIVKMDADGENRETIERSGWGVQYSPDGKHIAYSSYSNITLMDPETEKKTPLFEGDLANRYARIYWNFGWSPDSQAIAFKGHVRATGKQELAVVDINKPDKVEVLYSGNGIYEDFTFSPDSQRVLFALRQEGPTQPDLYLAPRKTPGQIERLKGQPDEYRILDCDWSPDGKEIVFAALVDPVPVEWPPETDSNDGKP